MHLLSGALYAKELSEEMDLVKPFVDQFMDSLLKQNQSAPFNQPTEVAMLIEGFEAPGADYQDLSNFDLQVTPKLSSYNPAAAASESYPSSTFSPTTIQQEIMENPFITIDFPFSTTNHCPSPFLFPNSVSSIPIPSPVQFPSPSVCPSSTVTPFLLFQEFLPPTPPLSPKHHVTLPENFENHLSTPAWRKREAPLLKKKVKSLSPSPDAGSEKACPVCLQRIDALSLSDHLKSHEKKDFRQYGKRCDGVCPFPECGGRKYKSLKSHLQVHFPLIKFVCQEGCSENKTFARRHDLLRHYRNVHNKIL